MWWNILLSIHKPVIITVNQHFSPTIWAMTWHFTIYVSNACTLINLLTHMRTANILLSENLCQNNAPIEVCLLWIKGFTKWPCSFFFFKNRFCSYLRLILISYFHLKFCVCFMSNHRYETNNIEDYSTNKSSL